MINTGLGVSILSLMILSIIISLWPYDTQRYAANGKTTKTVGMAEDVSFQLGGHTLKTNFIVIADNLSAEAFLLGVISCGRTTF